MKLSLEKIITVIHWGLFLGLCTISILSMREVYEKFQSKDSSFTQYEEPITQHPTTVMCFSPPFKNRTDPDLPLLLENQFEIGIDFNISFGYWSPKYKWKSYNWKDGMNYLEKDGLYYMSKIIQIVHICTLYVRSIETFSIFRFPNFIKYGKIGHTFPWKLLQSVTYNFNKEWGMDFYGNIF